MGPLEPKANRPGLKTDPDRPSGGTPGKPLVAIGFAGRFRADLGSLPSGGGPLEVVLANLIAGLRVPFAPMLRDEAAPGGRLLASGIFIDREAEVRGAFEAAGLVVDERVAEGDWVALTARRA